MSKHLKRLAAPRVLRIPRKERALTIRAAPGPHRFSQAIPLGLLIRDYLGLCDTYKEARKIISNGDILIDGVKRKNNKFPCGMMDVISIPKMRKYARILYDRKGKLVLVPISESDAEWKLCRIQNKTIIKGKKVQLNLHDGKNKLVEKDDYKTGDVGLTSGKSQVSKKSKSLHHQNQILWL
jgi:small subunit ribosomal protein S4e